MKPSPLSLTFLALHSLIWTYFSVCPLITPLPDPFCLLDLYTVFRMRLVFFHLMLSLTPSKPGRPSYFFLFKCYSSFKCKSSPTLITKSFQDITVPKDGSHGIQYLYCSFPVFSWEMTRLSSWRPRHKNQCALQLEFVSQWKILSSFSFQK